MCQMSEEVNRCKEHSILILTVIMANRGPQLVQYLKGTGFKHLG